MTISCDRRAGSPHDVIIGHGASREAAVLDAALQAPGRLRVDDVEVVTACEIDGSWTVLARPVPVHI